MGTYYAIDITIDSIDRSTYSFAIVASHLKFTYPRMEAFSIFKRLRFYLSLSQYAIILWTGYPLRLQGEEKTGGRS